MRNLGRLIRTVSHLAPPQIWHRLRYTARAAWWERTSQQVETRYRARASRLGPPRFDHSGLERVAELRRARIGAAQALVVARDALEGRFRFLGLSRELGREVEWYLPELDVGTRLWKTLLHEFPYGVELGIAYRETGDAAFRERFFDLLQQWRPLSPIGRPDFAVDVWDPRAAVTRMMHWMIAAWLFEISPDEPEGLALGRDLAVHALFVRDNLELDLRGNHLLRDYAGLAWAREILPGAPEGLELLRSELEEQILADGCHLERTPLYHAVVLQDLVECRALLGERSPTWLDDVVARMAGFLEYLIGESARLPLFGDTWLGEPEPQRLLEEAGGPRQAPAPGAPERASGIIVLRRGALRAVMRAGSHGPDYQLGHAHADGLSFELRHGETPLVTDTGTGTYDFGSVRLRSRATAAHNTLQIDGEEQIEAWDSFRVGRRGRGRVEARGSDSDWDWVWAAHDGWRWLPGRPIHHRVLAICPEAALALDAVVGAGRHRVRSALHIHPDAGDDFCALAFGAQATNVPAPLHERWGETREMNERCVEDQAELPWVGGWIVLAGEGVPDKVETELSREGECVVAQCRVGAVELEIRWNFTTPVRPDSLRLSRRVLAHP